jgi:hypothetical protein
MSKREKKVPCAICKEPTDLKGWHWVTPAGKKWSFTSGVKKYIPWCEKHFLVNQFNLWPFHCTAACHKATEKKIGFHMEPSNLYVWLDMGVVLVPGVPARAVRKAEKANQSIPLKPIKPKCPHCGKGMRLVEGAARHF